MTDPTPPGFCRRHYFVLAALVLGLSAFNLTYRLDREFVTEWDESLYAMSAWEMAGSHDWIGVRMFGNLDYSNTKPPLNVWLLVIAFETFGRNLFALRFFSVLSAWSTILALMVWSGRRFGEPVALTGGLILSTTFGFLHVHSGRTANTDALFTLLLSLVVITLSASGRRPWRRIYLGPLLAAAFLLRGMAVLMPLAIVLAMEVTDRRRWRERLAPIGVASLLFLSPIVAWAAARYRLDGLLFLQPLFTYDFVARSLEPLDGHAGGPLYYVNILVKHQYDWLLAVIAAAVITPGIAALARSVPARWRADREWLTLIAAWIGATVLIPTLMATKTPWYLNTFYPLFALGAAQLLVHAFRELSRAEARTRLIALSAIVVVACGIAEAKLWAYSLRYRDLSVSAQGLLFAEADRLAGRRVYRDRLDRSTTFVAGLVSVELVTAPGAEELVGPVERVERGDFVLVSSPPHHLRRRWIVVASNTGNWLLVRRPRDLPSLRRPD